MAKAGYGSPTMYLAKKEGDRKAKQFQDQLDAMNPGEKPMAEKFIRYTDDQGNFLNKNFEMQGGENWVQKAMAAQAAEEAALGNRATSQAAGAAAQSRSALASRGGLRGGAAERLAKASQRDTSQALQDINMQGMKSRADVGLQGENMNRQAQQMNIGTRIGDLTNQNQYNAKKYEQQMADWAAGKQAQATLMSGKGKGQSGGIMGGVGSVLGK